MTNTTIILRLKGGLGNQLFCYAAARRLSLANNSVLLIDDISGFVFDHTYKRSSCLSYFNIPVDFVRINIPISFFNRLNRFFDKSISKFLPLNLKSYIIQNSIDFDPRILELKPLRKNIIFEPFAQSEKYFEDISDIILSDLSMNISFNDTIIHNLEMIKNSNFSIAVHFRWFSGSSDYLHELSSYYLSAFNYFSLNKDSSFFIFTDNVDRTNDFISSLDLNVNLIFVNTGDSISDFWLMRQCDNFIISNSTFSWWAALLREYELNFSPIIIAPKFYLDPSRSVSAWGFPHLLPDRWIQL